MKKIVSLILAGLMSVSLFAIGASADTIEHDTKTTVVGADGGVTPDEWTDSTTSDGSDINVKVDKVVHKYAVDITFSFKDLTLGTVTWNVDTMRYDVEHGELKENTQTIEIANRSDLSVFAYATVDSASNGAHGTAAGLTITADKDSSTNKLEVVKATAGTTGSTSDEADTKGTATVGKLNITISSTDWNKAANYFANLKVDNEKDLTVDKLGTATQQSYKIATITVTISKD